MSLTLGYGGRSQEVRHNIKSYEEELFVTKMHDADRARKRFIAFIREYLTIYRGQGFFAAV